MNTLQYHLLLLPRFLHQTLKHYFIVLDLFKSVFEDSHVLIIFSD